MTSDDKPKTIQVRGIPWVKKPPRPHVPWVKKPKVIRSSVPWVKKPKRI